LTALALALALGNGLLLALPEATPPQPIIGESPSIGMEDEVVCNIGVVSIMLSLKSKMLALAVD
jgi:hypothetical protein